MENNQVISAEQLDDLIKSMGYDATLSRIAVAMSNALMSDEVYVHNAETLMKFVLAYEKAGFTREEADFLMAEANEAYVNWLAFCCAIDRQILLDVRDGEVVFIHPEHLAGHRSRHVHQSPPVDTTKLRRSSRS